MKRTKLNTTETTLIADKKSHRCTHTYKFRINKGLINRGLKKSVKYNKRGGWNKQGFLVYFDPNDVNVSKPAYVRTKL